MRRIGLILMVALLLAAGGVGLGWLAAEWQLDGDLGVGAESAGADPRPVDDAAVPAAKTLVERVEATRLGVAAERTGALSGELARLRWALAENRRVCRTEDAVASGPPVQVARAGPQSVIASPERAAPQADPPAGPVFAPARESAPTPPARADAATPPAPTGPAPSAPTPAPPAAPPAAQVPGQAMTVPEAAIRTRDLGFLNGCWTSSPFANPVNGVDSTKVYCFDGNGNGQMNFSGRDGVSCTAPIRARWEASRRLVLEEPRDGSCSNLGPWYREVTTCAIGSDGRARCNSYEFHRRFDYATQLTRN